MILRPINWQLPVDTSYCLSCQDKPSLLRKPDPLFYLQQLDTEKSPDLVPLISNFVLFTIIGSRDSIISIVTSYGVEGPEIEYRQEQNFFLPHTILSIVNLKNHRSYNSTPHINLLAPELIFLILAHSVYKMWITQEPNKLELWNKLHFKEKKKTESIHHV